MREIRVGFKVLKGPETEPVTVRELADCILQPKVCETKRAASLLQHLIPAARRRAEAESCRG